MNLLHCHEIYLHMLKVIDKICRDNNITYHIEGGTLLGAIREKGFIPWDDDCDITFYRNDYEKFKRIAIKTLEENGMILTDSYDNTEEFHDFVPRIFYTKEKYRIGKDYEKKFHGYYQYLWIDIFLLDDIKKEDINKAFFTQKLIYGLAMGHRAKDNFTKYNNVFLNAAAFILSRIGKLLPLTKINKLHKNYSLKYNGKNYNNVYASNYPAIWMNYENKKEDELDIIYVDFEDTKLPVIKNYDKYLKHFYGNYMERPPIDKQIPEHKEDIW